MGNYFVCVRGVDNGAERALTYTLLGSNGTDMCRLGTEGRYLTYSKDCAPSSARRLADMIRDHWSQSGPMMGFESYRESPCVGLVDLGEPDETRWAAVELDPSHIEAELSTFPFPVAGQPELRVVVGAEQRGMSGYSVVDVAVETRGGQFVDRHGKMGLIDKIESVELTATARSKNGDGRRDDRVSGLEGELREVSIVQDCTEEPHATAEDRLEAQFGLEPRVAAAYRDDPTLQLWLLVEFERSFLPVPPPWREFWIDIGGFPLET